MPPKKSPTLTEAELRLMEVLWQSGAGDGPPGYGSIACEVPLAYNSVLTTIRILEKKGYVQHVKEGRAHVYAPLVGKQEATRFEIKNLVGRFFKDSHELLVLNILEDKSINADELKRLGQLLQEHRGKP